MINVPDKPVAVQDDAATAQENGFVDVLDVVGNDTDVDNWTVNKPANFGLTVSFASAEGGAATIIGGTGIRFTPNLNWNSNRNGGAFSVHYYVRDAEGNVSEEGVTIPITVSPKNVKPRANGAGIQTDEDMPVAFSLPGDGGEGDEYANQSLSHTIVVSPSHGSVDLETMTYTPATNFHGEDSFAYYVTDDDQAGDEPFLDSDPATVTITVTAVNDAPTAGDASATTDEDTNGRNRSSTPEC